MEPSPPQPSEASRPLPYAHPTTILRSSLPLPIAMTLIICGAAIILGCLVTTGFGNGHPGSDPDVELAIIFVTGLLGAAMIVFGVLKSLSRNP